MIDGEIRGPYLRPLELWVDRVDVERRLQRGGVIRRAGRPQRPRGIEVRVVARIRDHVPHPHERDAAREDPGAPPHLRASVARGVPVEAKTWGPERGRA